MNTNSKNRPELLYDSLRRSGRTTRIIDECIQTLFNKGEVYVRDHYPTREASYYVFKRVLLRLSTEHSGLVDNGYIVASKPNLHIKLKSAI